MATISQLGCWTGRCFGGMQCRHGDEGAKTVDRVQRDVGYVRKERSINETVIYTWTGVEWIWGSNYSKAPWPTKAKPK